MLTGVAKICQNLADVICERSIISRSHASFFNLFINARCILITTITACESSKISPVKDLPLYNVR